MTRSAPRHLLAPTLAAALLLTACGGQDPADDPTPAASDTTSPAAGEEGTTPPDEPTTTPAPSASPSPTSTLHPGDERAQPGREVPELRDRCVVEVDLDRVDRIEFMAPDGWTVGDSCEFFDPAVEEIEPQTQPDVAITIKVTATPFHEVAGPDHTTRDEVRLVGAHSGYQAVRIRSEANGEGMWPEGMPLLTRLVDLDPGTDEAGGTLVASARPSAAADFRLASEALDRIMGTLLVRPAAGDSGEAAVVSRVEGGGTPWTVTLQDGCVRLQGGGPDDAVADEACDLGAPDEAVQGVVLSDGDLQVVAGLAPPRTARVLSDAASAPYGATTQSLEGAAAFAYTPVDVPVEVRAVDVEGQRLASATVR